ncbi:hypothetical protein AB0E67_29650, partial [Streptomyces sp. NPDC032161]|uniref:DUF6923 family protein n=1 Tax=unclassified Streptomyces TaxID=2593676 RepID=UPI0033BFC599
MAIKPARRGRHRRRRSLTGLVVMAMLTGFSAAAAPLFTAPASYAAAGDPFDPADPTVFVGQEIPTRLYKAITGASGGVTFQPEGTARAGLNYNSISYNTADNYLYGVVSNGSTVMPPGSIIRIGQGGAPICFVNPVRSVPWGGAGFRERPAKRDVP